MTRMVLLTSICLLVLGLLGAACAWFALPLVGVLMSAVSAVAGVVGAAVWMDPKGASRAAESEPPSVLPLQASVANERVSEPTGPTPSQPGRQPYRRWASRSSDRSQAGTVVDHVVNGQTFAVSGSALGDAHDQSGEGCDDAYALLPLSSGGFVVAVADGLGSTENAHLASDQATKSFVRQVQRSLDSVGHIDPHTWALISASACAAAAEAASIQHLAQLVDAGTLGRTYRHARRPKAETTLVGAVLTPTETGAQLAWVRVGDSDVGIVTANGNVRWLHDQTQHSNIVEDVLPDSPASADSGVCQLTPHELCILATDGFTEIADQSPAQLRRLRLDATQGRSPHSATLDLLLMWLPGVVDDRTFVLVGATDG